MNVDQAQEQTPEQASLSSDNAFSGIQKDDITIPDWVREFECADEDFDLEAFMEKLNDSEVEEFLSFFNFLLDEELSLMDRENGQNFNEDLQIRSVILNDSCDCYLFSTAEWHYKCKRFFLD